jgi:hypothetical protein
MKAEKSQFGSTFFSLSAEGNAAAKLTLSCAAGEQPSIQITLSEPPDSPPPLRGVLGSFKVGQEPARSVELAWGTRSQWLVRDDIVSAQLAKDFLRKGTFDFMPPAQYTNSEALRWTLPASGVEVDQAKQSCLP